MVTMPQNLPPRDPNSKTAQYHYHKARPFNILSPKKVLQNKLQHFFYLKIWPRGRHIIYFLNVDQLDDQPILGFLRL